MNISSKNLATTFYTNYINYTEQASGKKFRYFSAPYTTGDNIVIFMTSLWVKGTFGYPLQFNIVPQVINQTHYMWNATLYHNTMLTNVRFS